MDYSAEYLLELLKNNAELRGIYSAVCKKDFKSYILTLYYLVNGSKYKLKPFHLKVMKALQDLVEGKALKRNLALCLPVGCLSGDTVIRYNRASLGRKITLKDMYERQNNISKRYKWDLSIPTKVRSYIEKEDRIRLNEVDCVTYSGKKMVYKLTLEDGKSLKATIEHKIMTDKGFIELGNLKKGDMVMVDNIVGKKKKEESEATYRKNRKEKTKCVGKYHPYSKTSDNYSWRVELHRAIYEAHLNNMSLKDFCYACKFPNELKFVDPKIYHIHHIDHDHSNNDIENLQCLTKEEHLKLHGNYNHFGHGKPEYSAVKSIEEIGVEDTYDITCFDNPNFSANNIIVHNSGKSVLVEYFITWCFARSVDNMFVYTAYSDRLINKLSKETKDIIEHPAWKLLFNHFLKKDDRQKINYSFQGAKNRTGLTAGTMNSALTGIDAGVVSVDGFSGALICFPYDQLVWTNQGKLKIGEIVEKKLVVKVYSYNFDEREVELQPIEAYVRNEGDDIVRVTMKNGTSFECTKNHRVWTQNRGYVEAKDLIGGVDKVVSISQPSAGDLINPITIKNVLVVSVDFVRHDHTSFCLTVRNNHNMFVGESQAYLVKNCDDPSSADEIQFPNAREAVIRTYDEKLATRRRTPATPTILIMQRLHVDDLVGWTKKNEPDQWEYVEVPALDENDKSFWEERYPAEELKRIREINPYKFQAQYQQNPIIAGGQMIKSEWFQFYQTHPKYTRIFITSDTAMKTGQHNDYSVFMVWGVYQHSIYLIDMVRGKWEAPELLRQIRDLTNRYWLWENRLKMSALYIEDKASGVGLIQQMKRESRVPVIPLTPTKDKVSRVEEALPFLQAGRVFLPFNREYGQNPVIIGECEMFARDLSHAHDDVCFVAGTKVATLFGDKNIEDIKVDDMLLTPFGNTKVLEVGTREAEVITNIGLTGTPDHKILCLHGDIFDNLESMSYDNCSRFNLRGLLLWEKTKLLSSMEKNITLRERKDIILHATMSSIKNRGQGFIEMYGNFIAGKKYLKAMRFTILMAIRLIIVLKTLSVYRLLNIVQNIKKRRKKSGKDQKCKKRVREVEKNARFGTEAIRGKSGIANTKKKQSLKMLLKKFAQIVAQNLVLGKIRGSNLCAKNVETNISKESYEEKQKKIVYSIKTDKGVYYANGILVSNCDTLMYGIQVSSGLGRAVSIFET